MFEGDDFIPFAADPDKAPPFLPIGGKTLVRQTSSTHGVNGYITTDPEEIAMMQQRLKEKIEGTVDQYTFYDERLTPGAKTLIVTYGVTARAAKVAVERLQAQGQPASLLVLKTLWPVPEALIRKKAEGAKRIVVAEMNLGQYLQEIRRVLCDKPVDFIGEMNGNLIPPTRLKEKIVNG
jgi:2-oxoglutarate ferredoxin oxidoreductase subunit alpha